MVKVGGIPAGIPGATGNADERMQRDFTAKQELACGIERILSDPNHRFNPINTARMAKQDLKDPNSIVSRAMRVAAIQSQRPMQELIAERRAIVARYNQAGYSDGARFQLPGQPAVSKPVLLDFIPPLELRPPSSVPKPPCPPHAESS